MSSALAWLSSSIPAQASATTCTSTPSSAAASAVDRTQQSVETPASTIAATQDRAQLVAHLAEGRGLHRRVRLAGELVHELVDPRIRRLQRERPELVVAAPRPGGDGGSHEPGEDDVRAVGVDKPLDGAHHLGEPRCEPRAVALAEHPLHVDDHERRRPLRRARLAGHRWAAAGSSGGAPSWTRTPARPYIHCATNPSTSATSTPRLANAQAPVFPPRPNGPSR